MPFVKMKPSEPFSRPQARALWSIGFALFAAATSMSCVFAILPSVGRDLGLNETQLGWVVAPAALVFVLFGPVWGRLGGRWAARGIVTASLLMVAAFTLLFGHALAWRLGGRISPLLCFALLTASRVLLSPFSAAMLPTAQSYIAQTTAGAAHQRALAGMGAGFALGMVASPGLAAVATSAGLLTPFYVVAALLLLAAGGAWRFLPRALPQAGPAETSASARSSARTAWPLLGAPLAVLVLLYTVYGVLMQVTGFRMQDQFHLDARQATQHAGAALMATAAALVAAQMVLARTTVATPRGQRRVVVAGGACGLLGLALLLGAPPLAVQIAAMALFGLCLGVFMPFVLGLLTERAHAAGDQARVGGLSGAAQGLGMVIGPLLGAWSYRVNAQAPYGIALAALLAACALYVAATARRASGP